MVINEDGYTVMNKNEFGNYINGNWVKGDGDHLVGLNPATERPYWQGNEASTKEVEQSCDAARNAFFSWSQVPFEERVIVCERFSSSLSENKESLARIISQETGKPLWEAKTEVAAAAGKLKISLEAFNERTRERTSLQAEFRGVLRHKPIGIMAVLGPYNFPLHLPNGHIIPALIAGNTIIYKPSEQTPLTAMEMMKLWERSGLPKGVLNLVQGKAIVGRTLLNQTIDAVLFTGSASTGRSIHKKFAGRPEVLLALEMGGNNPLIVWGDNDIDAAVYNTIQSAYITSGQRCTCARRLIIQNDDSGELFLERLIDRTKELSIDSFDVTPEPFMGPVINTDTKAMLLDFQQRCLDKGGKSLLAMSPLSETGSFLSPGLIEMDKTQCEDLEIFGPLLQVFRVDSFNEAIALANNTRFGLSAGLLSNNKSLYEPFYKNIKAGIVNLNRPLTGAASNAPFGGTGLSGNHRPSAYYAADFCAYPVASLEADELSLPENVSPGMNWR